MDAQTSGKTTNKPRKPIFLHRNFQQQPFVPLQRNRSSKLQELFKVPTACSCGRYCFLLSVRAFVLRDGQRTIRSLWEPLGQKKWWDFPGTSVQWRRSNQSFSNQRRNKCWTTPVKSGWNAWRWFLLTRKESTGHCTEDVSQDIYKVNPGQEKDVFSFCSFLFFKKNLAWCWNSEGGVYARYCISPPGGDHCDSGAWVYNISPVWPLWCHIF